MLPAPFPHSTTMYKQDVVSNLVFEETVKLNIYKLSSLQSQTAVQQTLADFVASDTAEVCLLLANMQETTPKTINHVRVMMEEAELQLSDAQCCKMFVLLLHFPPAQFFQHCYPVLFLRGWDHCYLDTIAHNTEENNVVDVYNWLYRCCFPAESDSSVLRSPEALGKLLDQRISMLSARVYFGNKKDKSFNSLMNAAERSNVVRLLLSEKGLGDVLCERFLAYWTPSIMVKFLKTAAATSKERESTLNLTDSIQTQFKSLFTDFCIYMLTQANRNNNLDVIYSEDMSSPISVLFLNIFKICPAPKLEQLSALSNSLPCVQPSVHSPRFPFFNFVYELMEKQVDLSSKTVNLQMDILAESSDCIEGRELEDPSLVLQKYTVTVLKDLEPQSQVS